MLKLWPGIVYSVTLGLKRSDGYRWSGPGISSKKSYPTFEEAQRVAEAIAWKQLRESLASLEAMSEGREEEG